MEVCRSEVGSRGAKQTGVIWKLENRCGDLFRTYLEDHTSYTCKWLGSAPFISHEVEKAIWKGEYHNPILRGRNRSPWLLTAYKSWDDAPSKAYLEAIFSAIS